MSDGFKHSVAHRFSLKEAITKVLLIPVSVRVDLLLTVFAEMWKLFSTQNIKNLHILGFWGLRKNVEKSGQFWILFFSFSQIFFIWALLHFFILLACRYKTVNLSFIPTSPEGSYDQLNTRIQKNNLFAYQSIFLCPFVIRA